MKSDANTYTVYMHECTVNKKKYIGTTCLSPTARFKKGGTGYMGNKSMWKDIQQYGWDSFKHTVLYTGLKADTAYDLEVELIRKYHSNNPKYGYNIFPGGYKVPSGEDNPMSKSVFCCTQHGDIEYGSILEASRETGVSPHCIRKSIRKGVSYPSNVGEVIFTLAI